MSSFKFLIFVINKIHLQFKIVQIYIFDINFFIKESRACKSICVRIELFPLLLNIKVNKFDFENINTDKIA